MSLTETLASLGYTTRPAHQGCKHIVNAAGAVVFTGCAYEVWDWINGGRP